MKRLKQIIQQPKLTIQGIPALLKQIFAGREHRPADLVVSIVAFIFLFIMSRMILSNELPGWEVNMFRNVNNLPDWLFPFIWPFMQYGVFVTIPIVSAIAFYFKKYRLATLLLVGGVGIYFLARFIKEVVPRGRPEALLDNVNAREYFAPWSSGFTSGHTAVAATIATFVHHYLSQRWQAASIFTLAMVVFGRMYVGGHLPLDVFGGVALGIAVASLINFAVGVPATGKVKEDTKEWIRSHRPRHPGDVIRMGIAAVVFLTATGLAFGRQLSQLEEALFHLINYLPTFLSPVIQFIMQAGALYFVFIASAIALIATKHRRLSLKLLLGGTAGWWLARIAKEMVNRERPFFLIEQIVQRGVDSGLGFPSGHATVAAVLATVAVPYVTKSWRRALWVIVWITAIGRVYVGAHLPLDIFAGIALGWFLGSLLNFLFGTPAMPIPFRRIKERLSESNLAIKRVYQAEVDARGSTPIFAETKDGKGLFIKLLDSEHRNADILYRLWRHLTLREIEDEPPFASPKQIAEHEAYVSIQATQANVQAPKVLLATTVSSHASMIVTEKIAGDVLSNQKNISKRLLNDIWQQVNTLHQKRIAHLDLRASNILVDKKNKPWLIDFSFASTAASDYQIMKDNIELLVSTAIIVGAKKSVDAAQSVLDNHDFKKLLPYLQTMSLSRATRKTLKQNPGILNELEEYIKKLTDTRQVKKAQITRFNFQWLILIIIIGFAAYYLIQNTHELGRSIEVLDDANYWWLLVAVGASIATYLSSAFVVIGSTIKRLSYGSIVILQIATTAVNRVTPRGIGAIVLTEQYLEKRGLKRSEATVATSIIYASGILMHIVLLAATLLIVDYSVVDVFDLETSQLWLIGGAVAMSLVGIAFIPKLKRLTDKWRRELMKGMKHGINHPVRFVQLLGGSAGVTLAYSAALYVSLLAFGAHLSFGVVLLIYLVSSTIAAAAPTPSGLGAVEAALTVGLTAAGLSFGLALTSVLAFRLITFWLPILPGLVAFQRINKQMFGTTSKIPKKHVARPAQ